VQTGLDEMSIYVDRHNAQADKHLERLRSSRQGCNPAGESPAAPIARFGCVAIPQFMLGNRMIAAWSKRPSCSVTCVTG